MKPLITRKRALLSSHKSAKKQDSISGEFRNIGSPITHNRDISEAESRTVSVSWSDWVNTTKDSYSSWSPVASSQTDSFSQSRTYSQNQTRDRIYKAEGSTINTVAEVQSISSQMESRNVTVSWSNWTVTSGKSRYSCTAWSPTTNTVGYGVSFTQSQSCKQDQNRTRSYSVGGSFSESKTITTNHTQGATGVGSWTSHTPSYTTWSTYSVSVGSYSPAASSQTSNFTQTRSTTNNQERYKQNREIDVISGTVRNSGSSIRETRSVSGANQSRTSVSGSGWSYSSNHSYGSYSPATSTVCSGDSFTQTRSYTERQAYTYSYSVGGSYTVYRDIGRSQSRNASGSKTCENWVAASSTTSSWSNSGGIYSCSSWGPSTSTVNLNQSYTQSRSCSQNQTRTVTTRQVDTISGAIRATGSYSESRTISVSDTRSATGTKDYITNTNYKETFYQTSSWSCGSWSPSTSTVTIGQSFTQSRTCTRVKSEWYRRYEVWASGRKDLVATVNRNNDITKSKNETRAGTGTKSYQWGSASITYSGPTLFDSVMCYHMGNASQSAKTGSCTTKGAVNNYMDAYQSAKTGSCTTKGAVNNYMDAYIGVNHCAERRYTQTCG